MIIQRMKELDSVPATVMDVRRAIEL